MVSTKKSSLDLNQNGNFLQHLERDAALPLIQTDKQNLEILLFLYLSLLRETYSPEVITLHIYASRGKAIKYGISEEAFNSVVDTVIEFWQNNKSPISGMF